MLSLFSGVGGLDLAAMEAGIETVALCEIEPYPTKILEKRFPGVKIYDDVRSITRDRLEADGILPINIIAGGFPCQDLSVAGQQKGLTDEEGNITRSGLWFKMFEIIQEVRPTWVVVENVRGAVNIALDTVTSNLESEGYEVRSIVIPACAFGAPHQRERLFIVGYSQHNG